MEERPRWAGQWWRREKEVGGLQSRTLLTRIVDGLLGPKRGKGLCVCGRSVCVKSVYVCVCVCVCMHVCVRSVCEKCGCMGGCVCVCVCAYKSYICTI